MVSPEEFNLRKEIKDLKKRNAWLERHEKDKSSGTANIGNGNGNGNGNSTINAAPVKKAATCIKYRKSKYGYCPDGDSCSYKHTLSPLQREEREKARKWVEEGVEESE